MSLNWSVTNIPSYAENFPDLVTPDGNQWNAVTHALLMAMMIVGPLEEKNYEEFAERLDIYQYYIGALLSKAGTDGKGEEVFITRQQIKQHIGITVNVSPITKSAFEKNIIRIMREDIRRRVRWEHKQADAAKEEGIKC
jgi:hypothetical protein